MYAVLETGGKQIRVEVVAKVVKQGLSKKIRIYKYKAKTDSRRKQGHRQPYTCLVIEAINA